MAGFFRDFSRSGKGVPKDAPDKKPFSIVCDFERVYDTMLLALEEKQLEPIIF